MTAAVDRGKARVGERSDRFRRAPGDRGRRGPLVAAAGAFCMTFALLTHFYVYPRIAVLPAQAHQVWTLEDRGGTYVDTAQWRTREDVEVVQHTELVGRPMPGNSDWAVWTITVDTSGPLGLIDHHSRKVIVDRATAKAVNCCGEHVDGDFAVRQAGLIALWPPAAEGTEHPFYDPDTRAAPVMRLDGTDEVSGIAARRYVQVVPPTQVPGSAHDAPAAELGLDRSGTVRVTRWVEVTRTYWVEPVSGHVLDIAEQRRETLRTTEGGGERLVLDADLRMRPGQVQARIQRASDRALLLTLVRAWLPLLLGAAGALVAAVEAVRAARR